MFHSVPIYTTKIDEFVCRPNISETVAVKTMKLAHRPRIASTTIKLISKPILLSILSILLKKQFSESALAPSVNRRRHLFVYGDSAHYVHFCFMDNLVPSGRSFCIILFSLLIRIVLTCSYGELNCDWAAYSTYIHLHHYSTAYIHT